MGGSASFVQPNYAAQSGSVYPAAIDASVQVLAVVGQMFAPHQRTDVAPNMTVQVDAGALFVNGARVVQAQQNTGTITAPVTNPRIDRVVVDAITGAVSVVTGTEAGSPTAPAIPAGKIPCCQVALATSTTAIANSLITDERCISAAASSNGAGGTDGQVQVADSTQTNGRIWTNYYKPNAIIGGDFSLNPWQRAISAAVANGVYTADRWLYNKVGAMVHNISKSADAPTVAQAGKLITHCMLVDCTTVDSSIAAGDHCEIGQKIEGYNFRSIAQVGGAIGFWHKHTKTGTHCAAIRNSGSDRSYVFTYNQAVTDTWEFASAVIPASPSAGTWDYTTGVGAWLTFSLACGSTFQTTAGAWQTGNFLGTSAQVNDCDDTANNFRIADVNFIPGNVVLPAMPEDIGLVLRKCLRYYQIYKGDTDAIMSIPGGVGTVQSTSTTFFVVPFPVAMLRAPLTADVSSSRLTDLRVKDGTNIGTASALSIGQGSSPPLTGEQSTILIVTTNAVMAVGRAAYLINVGGANATDLQFNVEL